MNSVEQSARLEPDPILPLIRQPSASIGPYEKDNINLPAQIQAEITKRHQFAGDVEDSTKRLLCLETTNEILKTESQKYLENNSGSEKLVNMTEDAGTIGASTPGIKKMYCTSAEEEEVRAVLSKQTKRSFQQECSSECNNSQEEGDNTHGIYFSAVQQQTESLADESYNAKNELCKESGSMQVEMTLLQQEVQAKSELVQVLEKQIENLQQALQESRYENSSIKNKYQRSIEEHICSKSNTKSKTSGAELAHAQEENLQKLRKELSAKVIELRNLQIMFSSLGKEKQVMISELALKVRLLGDMEEHLNDMKELNKTLSNKLISYAKEHKSKTREMQGKITLLQNRDKLLADQLLKSLEGCRTLKRNLKELQEHNRVLKREIGSLKSSIQKQEQSSHTLESGRRALQNELTWGKEQLHVLQESCKCFKVKTESVTKQDLTKANRQKSFSGEVASLEQLMVQFKEEIKIFKEESHVKGTECQVLKEEIAQLQTQLSYLRAENNSLKQGGPSDLIEKKLGENNLQCKNAVMGNKISTTGEKIKNMDRECRELRNSVQEMGGEEVKRNLLFDNSVDKVEQVNECVGFHLQSMPTEDEGAKSRMSSSNEQFLLYHKDRNTNIEEEQVSSTGDASDMPFWKKKNHQAEMSQSHSGDIIIQVLNKSSVVYSMEQGNKVVGSQISSLADQIKEPYPSDE